MVELHVYHSVRFQLNDRDLSCPNILSLRLYQGPVGWLWPDHQSVPRGAGLTVPVPGHQPFRRGPYPGPPPTPRAPVGSPGTHTGGYWWSLTLNWRTNKAKVELPLESFGLNVTTCIEYTCMLKCDLPFFRGNTFHLTPHVHLIVFLVLLP